MTTSEVPSTPQTLRTRLVLHGSWAMAGTTLVAAATFFLNVVLARVLDPAPLGTYLLALSIVMPASVVVLGGTQQAVVQLVTSHLALERHADARHLARLIAIFAALCVLLGAGGWLLVGDWFAKELLKSEPLSELTPIIALWIAATAIQFFLAEFLRAFHDIRLASVFGGFGGAVAGGVAVVTFAACGALDVRLDPETVITTQVLIIAAAIVAATVAVLRKVSSIPEGGEPRTSALGWRLLLATSLPFLVANLTVVVIMQLDLWFVSANESADYVAVYGSASRLAWGVALPYAIMVAIVTPLIADLHARGRHNELERALRATTTALCLPSLAITAVFVLAGGPVLQLAYGTPYQSGGTVLALLAVGQAVHVALGPAGELLMMSGYQRVHMAMYVGAGILAITALYFVQEQGGTIIAATVTIVIVVHKFVTVAVARRLTGISTVLSPMSLLRRGSAA